MQPVAANLGPCHKCPAGMCFQASFAGKACGRAVPQSLLLPCCAVLRCAVSCCVMLCFGVAGFLMLAVNWSAIHAECLMPHERTHSCDLLAVAIHKHPLRDHSRGLVGVAGPAWEGKRDEEGLLLLLHTIGQRGHCCGCKCCRDLQGQRARQQSQWQALQLAPQPCVSMMWPGTQPLRQQSVATRSPPTVGYVPAAVKLGGSSSMSAGAAAGA